MHVYDFTVRITTTESEGYPEVTPEEIIEQIKNEVDSDIYGVEVQDIKFTEVKQ